MPNSTSPATVKVWDIGVRLFHWGLVTMTGLAYVFVDPRMLHRNLGYAVIALIAFRLVWGVLGSHHARFVNFIPAPKRLMSYLRDMLARREARYLGHNPAGAVMVVTLLVLLGAVSATGYMMGMDAYFGQSWVEHLHEAAVNVLLVCVVLHVSGVIYASWRHRENLVASMITGQKTTHDTQHP